MDTMLKVTACAVTAAVLSVVLKKNVPELSLLLVVAAGVWMLRIGVRGMSVVVDLMKELVRLSGVSEVLLEPVVKTVLLTTLTKLTAELCRGTGESGIAALVESVGAVLALLAALPLVRAVVDLMTELLT